MTPSARRLTSALVALVLVIPLAVVPATAQDLESAEQRVEDLQGKLAEATARYEDIHARLVLAEDELAKLEQREQELKDEIATVGEALELRARAAFKRGTDSVLSSLVSADGPQGVVERAGLLQAVQSRDQSQLEHAHSLNIQLDQTRQLLDDQRAELEGLRAQQQELQAVLEDELADAEVVASELREIEARRRKIQRGVQSGTYACIFDRGATHFRDTWGAPRSGGRSHKGTDVFAAYGQPVYAFTDGYIKRMNSSGLGGISIWQQGDDGNLYYYTHLKGYAPSAHVGQRVRAGEHIAYNGASGNASMSAPHVHFQMHPGGGAPVNPYEWLAAACF